MNQWLTDLGLPANVNYVPWVIGLCVAVIVGGIGIARLTRRKPPPPPPPENPPAPPVHDPFTQGSGREGRQEPRRRGGNVSVQISDPTGKIKPYEGWVVDRSTWGLCLAVEETFEVDTVMRVRPVHTEPVPWVSVRVRHCRRSGTGFEIGCQFLQPPQAAIRMLFG